MSSPGDVVLLPDAGPLITLAYADALDLLLRPVWSVALVDRVLHEVTRNPTPTSEKLARWAAARKLPVLPTRIGQHYGESQSSEAAATRKSNLGELAIQEAMNFFALELPPKIAVFLFEDHKIARAGFLVPDNCRKVPAVHPQLGCGRRVNKAQKRSVQKEARGAGEDLGRRIELVAENGVADSLQVHPHLVRAPGFQEEVDPRRIQRRLAARHAQPGARGLADGVVHHLARAVGPIGDQRQFDHALARRRAPGQGEQNLGYQGTTLSSNIRRDTVPPEPGNPLKPTPLKPALASSLRRHYD